jgi:hypothetical protein
MDKKVARKLIADIHKVPVFERHILKNKVNYGSVSFAPIMNWGDRIEILVDTRRNVFQKAIDKFVEEHEDILRFAYFVKGQDFTPYVVFWVKKEYRH